MSYFQKEAQEQGQALRGAAEAYRDQGSTALREAARLAAQRPLLFTGMGSSWAAALAMEAYLVKEGRAAVAVDSSEALYRWAPVMGPRGFLPVLISQSGESREVVRLAGLLETPFIAITNVPDSTLARQAAVVLALHAGHEEGVTTKTFVNTVAVGMLLCRTILDQRSEAKLAEMARLLEIAEFLEAAAALDGLLQKRDQVVKVQRLLTSGEPPAGPPRNPATQPMSWDLIGRGAGLAAVHQGALVLRELTGRVIAPFTGGLYRHGPVYRSGPSTRAIILASSAEEGGLLVRLAGDILDRGGRVAFLSDFQPQIQSGELAHLLLPPVAPSLFSIPAMAPLDLLALIDAAARGFEPGIGAPKVTPVE